MLVREHGEDCEDRDLAGSEAGGIRSERRADGGRSVDGHGVDGPGSGADWRARASRPRTLSFDISRITA